MPPKSPPYGNTASLSPAVSIQTDFAAPRRNLKDRARNCLEQDRSEAVGVQASYAIPAGLVSSKRLTDSEAAVIRQSLNICRRIAHLVGGTEI